MTCNRCNKQPCDCNSDPCGKKCQPARYSCGFDIQVDPFDPTTWLFTNCGATRRVKIPKIAETDTTLKTDYSNATLNYHSEQHVDTITGEQLGSLINLKELRDVDTPDPANCGILTWNPGCSECGNGCEPLEAKWRAYTIPDAGNDDIAAVDSNGYYHVLGKNDCGCIVEKKVPIVPSGMASFNYVRDSVPDDPDFPWYYGCYNDTINLHLAENAPRYFNKYDLKVTVNYGVQVIVSDHCSNVNFRSLVAPVVQGGNEKYAVENAASILQGFAFYTAGFTARDVPWGSASLRGSFTFLVPKGKEAHLRHEFRLRSAVSSETTWPGYYHCAKDGQKVPDSEATIDSILYPASRLNALQVIVEPTVGSVSYDPAADTIRNQLDSPTDASPNIN